MSSSPPADKRRAWSPGAWSLRARLLVGQIVLLAVVSVVIGTVTTLALQQFLIHQLDDQLIDAGHRSVAMSGGMPPPGFPAGDRRQHTPVAGPGPDFLDAPGQPPGTVGAIVTGGTATDAGVLTISGSRAALSAAAEQQLDGLPADSRPHTQNLDGLGSYRLIATQTQKGDVIVTGLSLSTVNDTLVRVATIFAVVAVLALLAAITAGILIIRRALHPLTRVAATAGQVADLQLDRGEVELPVRVSAADTNPRTEVGQLGIALNRMLDHIAGALSARQASETRVRQFVADASHELRTPLTAIRGYAELAQRDQHAVPEQVAHAMGRVESEAQRMTSLVEDLLLLARLDSGRPLEHEHVDLSLLAVDAVSDAHIAGPDHEWNLDLPDEPVMVVGDSARLHQVLSNLLANARTHTGAGTSVTTSITLGAQNTAVLTVVDNGPGIPPDLLGDVFERFARGDTSRSRKAGSTGLGLAIVSAVVKAHNGTIAVRSVPGRTEFTVQLPAATTDVQSQRTHSSDK
ncbi:sensor histidine kinase [Antrihabitans cavernicola]|uniref:histidine kinase n=1 Tax=Antrihabitans cavernicola TaxID=2495913 RepID=A0A5A7S838_9NOCA|nr:HAMP domain-containing sensor histidine kinase [Spelaeibacter cavernicola]KAA0018082.1 HAMP domain-containing histidine kinase [Spelaeibacter cavernicola]